MQWRMARRWSNCGQDTLALVKVLEKLKLTGAGCL
jgi:hypothetical protein